MTLDTGSVPHHTGEWYVTEENDDGTMYVWGPDGDAVAEIYGGYGEIDDVGEGYETSASRAILVAAAPKLLLEVERLQAEVERLTPDAALGAAVRRMGLGLRLGQYRQNRIVLDAPDHIVWAVVDAPRADGSEPVVGSADTPDRALAIAGLMDEEGDDAE